MRRVLVPLAHGRPGDIVAVKGYFGPRKITKIEMMLVLGCDHPVERINRVEREEGAEDPWEFFETTIDPHDWDRVLEARVMRRVYNAPPRELDSFTDEKRVEYDGKLFVAVSGQSAESQVIELEVDGMVEDATCSWITLEAYEGSMTHVLVYADWGFGNGVYVGEVVDKSLVTMSLKEAQKEEEGEAEESVPAPAA